MYFLCVTQTTTIILSLRTQEGPLTCAILELPSVLSYPSRVDHHIIMSSSFQETRDPVVVDGVHRLSPTGISILIVGGGVGGMMTALESWRQGHNVRILERNEKLDTIGTSLDIRYHI